VFQPWPARYVRRMYAHSSKNPGARTRFGGVQSVRCASLEATRRSSAKLRQLPIPGMTGRNIACRGQRFVPSPLGERGDARSGTPTATAVVRADTRAIGGTRRGPTRRARVRPRPQVQSLCPLDAWRTLRDEPWQRYRHHFTTTEERVRPAGLCFSRKSRKTSRDLKPAPWALRLFAHARNSRSQAA
jgi:hypothetical protein